MSIATQTNRAEAPISEAACVAWITELLTTTTDPGLHRLASDVLREIQELGPLAGDHELEKLVLGALASVEAAFETAA